MNNDDYYNLSDKIYDVEHNLKKQVQELQIENLFLLHTIHMQNLKLNQAIPNLNLPTYEKQLIFEPLEVFESSNSQVFAYTAKFYIHEYYGEEGLPLKTLHVLNYAEQYYPIYSHAFDNVFEFLKKGYFINRFGTKYTLYNPKHLADYFTNLDLLPKHKFHL